MILLPRWLRHMMIYQDCQRACYYELRTFKLNRVLSGRISPCDSIPAVCTPYSVNVHVGLRVWLRKRTVMNSKLKTVEARV